MLRTSRVGPWILAFLAASLWMGSGCPAQSTSGPSQAAEESSGERTDWQDLLTDLDPRTQSVAGEWRFQNQRLSVAAAEGARLELIRPEAAEYDWQVSFTRRSGRDSIALIFPVGDGQATLELDAWGAHLAGFQLVDGQPLNRTSREIKRVQLENGRGYTVELRVRRDSVSAWLDGEPLDSIDLSEHRLSALDLWATEHPNRLALGAWNSATVFESVRWRRGQAESVASDTPRTSPPEPTTPDPTPSNPTTPRPMPAPEPGAASAPPRVLMVIANHHFFYREYGEPREELERAGFEVVVAAGRRAVCRPHQGSGQGADGGEVQPDVALSQVSADDFDAILFSGGWGASAYQFAFPGRYDDAAYNGDREVKREVNRLINEFIEQDKYVAALCNGVSILAWARVDGESPLNGKTVCAPVRQAAPGIYNGRRAQPSCRWHPEANGARMSPPGSIGRPNTASDDIAVDGKIITGEDDISAREMGRVLVKLLREE